MLCCFIMFFFFFWLYVYHAASESSESCKSLFLQMKFKFMLWSFIPQVQETIRTIIVWGLTCTLGSQRSRCRNLPRLLGWSVIRQISPSSLSPCSAVKQTSARNASLLTAVARIPPRYRCAAADLKISNSTRITPPNFTVSPCHPRRVCTCGHLSIRFYLFICYRFFSGLRRLNLVYGFKGSQLWLSTAKNACIK